MIPYVLTVLPGLLLLLSGLWARRRYQSWLYPGGVFSLYWGGILIAVAGFPVEPHFWPGAAWVLCAFGVLLILGGLASDKLFVLREQRPPQCHSFLLGGRMIILSSSILGLLAAVLLARNIGYPASSILSPQGIIRLGEKYASLRYSQGKGLPFFVNVLNAFFYAGMIYSGVWVKVSANRWHRFIVILPLGVGLLLAFLVNARTNLIWGIIFMISAYMAGSVFRGEHREFFTMKRIIAGMTIFVLLIAFYIVLQTFRDPRYADIQLSILKARVSILSPPIAFSVWLKENWKLLDPSWGAKTFGGVFDILGLVERKQGVGWEGTVFQVNGQIFRPNVYTAFRQLIEDFTLPGTMLMMFVLGIIVSTAYKRLEQGHFAWIPVLSLFYALVVGSYLANFMYYNSLLLSWVIFSVIIISPCYLLIYRRRHA